MSEVYVMHYANRCKSVLLQHCTKLSYSLSGMTRLLCVEMRVSRVIAEASPASQVAPSRKLGTGNARVKAKAEAGRNCKALTRKAQVLRARAVLVGHSRIRVADSLGPVTSVAKRAPGQQTAHRKEECRP